MFLEALKQEFLRYKTLAEAAIRQVNDEDLAKKMGPEGNSIAILMAHMAGNLKSRFTDFLTTDGEKPWRTRDQEFEDQGAERTALLDSWNEGWNILFDVLEQLTEMDLKKEVQIRGISLSVTKALMRSVSHAAYHSGQMVLLARHFQGQDWEWLSIPKGKSLEYNLNPPLEHNPPAP